MPPLMIAEAAADAAVLRRETELGFTKVAGSSMGSRAAITNRRCFPSRGGTPGRPGMNRAGAPARRTTGRLRGTAAALRRRDTQPRPDSPGGTGPARVVGTPRRTADVLWDGDGSADPSPGRTPPGRPSEMNASASTSALH
ncbi:hypothetical protein GCM10010421_10110 [Streptomyces glaucus]|uniref:Secreted protein n=1 Tax=Streptomyces glaucus TaxID=284029 RepID=A0ABN3JC54_9ACTN